MIILFAVFCLNGFAQEYLTNFYGGVYEMISQKSESETVVTLPFFDDFKGNGAYLNQKKWQSLCVIANSGFPYKPVNQRAATLDVIDEFGKVYARGSSNPFIADSLLSVRIRLDSIGKQALTPADSVYLSFYYQPGGRGDSPERDDSLVLQFGYGYDHKIFDTITQDSVTVRDIAWKQMWATEGVSLDTFLLSCGENHFFKKVMIPITDQRFFVEDFYLLFFNYGTLPTTMYPNDRSNMDQWNIDFVYLDKNRSVDNDFYPLVSLTETAPSFLSRYQSMPYKHYKENPIVAINNNFDMFLTNLDVNAHQIRYSCEVTDDNNPSWSYYYQNNPSIISQYSSEGVDSLRVTMGDFIYPYNNTYDTTTFTIRHSVEVVDEHSGEVAGDVMVRKQGFYNYFSYDDGVPEKGYGLVPDDTYMAAQFNVTRLDTLGGVQILFNRTFNDANYNFFDIVVWRDNNGKPGEVIYTLENQRPIWDDSLVYNFSYYEFDEVVKVNSTFYVGIRQQYSKSINIGFDTSNDNRQYCFYEVGNGWKNTSFVGSFMIRPVMGGEPYFVGVEENQEVTSNLRIYPNPASDVVHISGIDAENCEEICVYDVSGRVVKSSRYVNELNISDLSDGVYMIRVIGKGGMSDTSKLFIFK